MTGRIATRRGHAILKSLCEGRVTSVDFSTGMRVGAQYALEAGDPDRFRADWAARPAWPAPTAQATGSWHSRRGPNPLLMFGQPGYPAGHGAGRVLLCGIYGAVDLLVGLMVGVTLREPRYFVDSLVRLLGVLLGVGLRLLLQVVELAQPGRINRPRG